MSYIDNVAPITFDLFRSIALSLPDMKGVGISYELPIFLNTLGATRGSFDQLQVDLQDENFKFIPISLVQLLLDTRKKWRT